MLYLHAKGMRDNGDKTAVAGWRRYMVYFLAERWDLCLGLLQQSSMDAAYHTCGVEANAEEYAGNMWWSSAQWLAETRGVLHVPWNFNSRYEAEDFLFRRKESSSLKRRGYCMFEITHNLYDCPSPRELYTGNNSVPIPLRHQESCYRPNNIIRQGGGGCFVVRTQ